MLSKHTGKYDKYYVGKRCDGTNYIELEKVIYYVNPKIPFVYIWYDSKSKKFYIGSHNGKSQAYTHSSKRMEKFWYDDVPLHMSRKILKTFTSDKEAKSFEKKLIRERLNKNPDKYYNVF